MAKENSSLLVWAALIGGGIYFYKKHQDATQPAPEPGAPVNPIQAVINNVANGIDKVVEMIAPAPVLPYTDLLLTDEKDAYPRYYDAPVVPEPVVVPEDEKVLYDAAGTPISPLYNIVPFFDSVIDQGAIVSNADFHNVYHKPLDQELRYASSSYLEYDENGNVRQKPISYDVLYQDTFIV